MVEYIKGQTLRIVLEEHAPNPLPIVEAIRITLQICEAMAYCHEQGIFHRDIKPENIMVQEDGNIKIIDFGIALLEGARRVTWRGLSGTVGTPDYMSPEQLKGERGMAGSDIYAVGVMLYEMLCGHTPFEGENIFAIMNQHVSQDPPSILLENPQLSPALATVVMRAIRRDQEKRYKSMSDFLHDLRNLEEVKPVLMSQRHHVSTGLAEPRSRPPSSLSPFACSLLRWASLCSLSIMSAIKIVASLWLHCNIPGEKESTDADPILPTYLYYWRCPRPTEKACQAAAGCATDRC